jgi:CHAD domain-containing protein
MSRKPPDKWVAVDPGKETVADVCVKTLRGRFDAVLFHLPRAADLASQDVEHVHQLRIWTRRAAAALDLYEDLLPKRRLRRLKKQLKRIRQAANDARDCDVLVARLRHKPDDEAHRCWQESAQSDRLKAQQSIVFVRDRLELEFARRIDKLLERVRPTEESAEGFQDWAQDRLRRVVKRFFDAVPADPRDEPALHRFRIRGKELRSGVELLAGAFPESLRTDVYPTLKSIQDKLGEINDLATAIDRLTRHIRAAKNLRVAAPWRRLRNAEQQLLDESIRQFWSWCEAGRLRDLRNGFTALLATPAQG